MGSIVGAALVSHVPPLVMPESERRALNGGEDTSLFAGLHALRAERLAPAAADPVVVVDTHWFTTIEHVISAHERRKGLFTSDELPRGMCAMPYDMPGDPELARAFVAAATGRHDAWVTAIDDPHLPVHYPTINLLGFLQGEERWVSMGVCQTAEPDGLPAGRPASGLRGGRCRPPGGGAGKRRAQPPLLAAAAVPRPRGRRSRAPHPHPRGGRGRPPGCSLVWPPATTPPSSTSCPNTPATLPRATSATT